MIQRTQLEKKILPVFFRKNVIFNLTESLLELILNTISICYNA